MINICISINDITGNYSKFAGVTIASILANTKRKVHFYLLSDNSLTNENKEKFLELVNKEDQHIDFIKVDIPKEVLIGAPPRATVGHFFRLKIPEVMPNSIDKVLYLDADLIVNLDVGDLWDLPFAGKLILGRLESSLKNVLFESGILTLSEYVNSGVLLMDLKNIRRHHNLFKESLDFFHHYPYPKRQFVDQDAINYIFRGEIGYFSRTYNYFTTEMRGTKEALHVLPVIYHFAGDHVCDPASFKGDLLFLQYLESTPWKEWEKTFWIKRVSIHQRMGRRIAIEREKLWIENIILRSRLNTTVFWGIKGKIHDDVMSLFSPKQEDFYVDNNLSCVKSMKDGLYAYPSSAVTGRQDELLIIVTTLRYEEVLEQLLNLGFARDNVIDGRSLLYQEKDIIERYDFLSNQDVDGFHKTP